MIINKLRLTNFGRFQNKELLLKEGINVIYGENESGKSTVHTFLQSMFFGIRRMRGRASRTDSYTKYAPWEHSGWYEGAVTFTCGQKRFRLERNFQKAKEDAVLFCETDGELLSVKDGDLHMLLGNISETVYCNTVSVGQSKTTTEEGLYRELRDYLSEFQGSGDMRFDPEKAMEILKQKKKIQEKKESDAIEKKEKEEEKLGYEIRHEQEEIQSINRKLQELQLRIHELEAEENQVPSVDANTLEKGKRRQSALRILAVAGLVFFVLLAVLDRVSWYGILPWILFLAAEELAAFAGKKQKPEEPEPGLSQETVLRMAKLKERMKMLLENRKERQTRLENLQEEYEEIREDRREILSVRKEIQQLSEAGNRIQEAAARMQNKTGGVLQKKMSEILCSLTQGKYERVILDRDFTIHLDAKEKCLALHQVSFGTVEQVYLALRLACGKILCREEEMPLILDETFAMYDEKRLFNTLKWIHREYSQVILFSCHKREIRALESMGIPYHLVNLQEQEEIRV